MSKSKKAYNERRKLRLKAENARLEAEKAKAASVAKVAKASAIKAAIEAEEALQLAEAREAEKVPMAIGEIRFGYVSYKCRYKVEKLKSGKVRFWWIDSGGWENEHNALILESEVGEVAKGYYQW